MSLGGRSIDLVGQKQLGENRAGAEAEVADPLVVNRRPRDVRGHQVGSELDPFERTAQHAAERAHEERLAQAGHAFDQDVPLGQKRRQHAPHQRALTDEDLVDFQEHALGPGNDRAARSVAPFRAGRGDAIFGGGLRKRFVVIHRISAFPSCAGSDR